MAPSTRSTRQTRGTVSQGRAGRRKAHRHVGASGNGFGSYTPLTASPDNEEASGSSNVDMDTVDDFMLEVVKALESMKEESMTDEPVTDPPDDSYLYGIELWRDIDLPPELDALGPAGLEDRDPRRQDRDYSPPTSPSSIVYSDSSENMREVPPTPYWSSPEPDDRPYSDYDDEHIKSYYEIYGDALPLTPLCGSPASGSSSLPPIDESMILESVSSSVDSSFESSSLSMPSTSQPQKPAPQPLNSTSSGPASASVPYFPQRRSDRLAALQAAAGVVPDLKAKTAPRRRRGKQK
ncbi:hypothetical protein OBBRIDRAFT_826703 [Obba rivulosa]|uniref:Uncharacterized protein n=1 Tax=Obba rivulosa TaxID=1052685 RepID=A0A8E2AVN0_9APHY|nr:hypothetical protein OBBRIDRAFT_826703 [Obba rivulosa]